MSSNITAPSASISTANHTSSSSLAAMSSIPEHTPSNQSTYTSTGPAATAMSSRPSSSDIHTHDTHSHTTTHIHTSSSTEGTIPATRSSLSLNVPANHIPQAAPGSTAAVGHTVENSIPLSIFPISAEKFIVCFCGEYSQLYIVVYRLINRQ
jgi:hypothetical protein